MNAVYTNNAHLPYVFSEADKVYDALKDSVQSETWLTKSHDEVELLLETHGRELLRVLYQAYLTLVGQRKVNEKSVVGVDSVERTHRKTSVRTLSSLFGKVKVERVGFGARQTSSVFPVDAELNLPKESYSLALRKRVARLVAGNSFDEVVDLLRESTGTEINKRQVLELTARAAQDFDAFYEHRQAAALDEEPSEILVISIDRKGVSMRPEDLREKTRKAAKTTKPKLDKRRSVGERRNRKRMSVVAAVYTVDPWLRTPEDVVAGLQGESQLAKQRPKPQRKRIWASVRHEPDEVVRQAFDEALSRDPERKKHWVVLVDGDRNQLVWLKRMAKRYKVAITIIVDVIHVIEYLWGAAHAFHGPYTKEAEQWVAGRLNKILEGKAGWVAGAMRRSAKQRGLSKEKYKRVEKAANYLKNYAKYLRYGEALSQGFPIATGVIEGACRYLIGDRLEITGARWSVDGAESVLRLRALRASGDLEEYWPFHKQQEYQRNHGSLYKDGCHPKPLPNGSGSHLRLVEAPSL